MKVSLVFTPAGDPTRPHLDLPMVQAVLRQRGFMDTHLLDANIQAYWYFLDPFRLEQAHQFVQSRLADLDSKSSLTPSEGIEYYNIARVALSAPFVIERIGQALGILRNWNEFINFEKYTCAIRVLERGLLLASAPYYPTRFLFDYKMSLSTKSTSEVERSLSDDTNLFTDFFLNEIIPQIIQINAELVVLPITLRSQLIPVLTLARLLKQVMPQTHINLTGVFIHYYAETFSNWQELFRMTDSVTVGAFRQYEGAFSDAEVVARLAQALANGKPLHDLPGLIFRDQSTDRIQKMPMEQTATDIEALPPPDFDGLVDEKYLVPEIVWPLALTKGCYWGRCAFCTRLEPYAQRSAERVYTDMQYLQKRWDAKYFYFTDDGIRPELIRSLSKRLTAALPGVFWHSMARFDRHLDHETCLLMYRGGCRCLEFGLESAAARILEASKKGTTIQTIRDVLANCRKAGINSRVFCIAGFPGETPAETRQTLDFLLENKDIISSVRIVRFMLEPGSYIESHPAEFGISKIVSEPDRDLAANVLYEVSDGAGMHESLQIQAEAVDRVNQIYGGRLAYQTFRQHVFLHTIHHKRPFFEYTAAQTTDIGDFHETSIFDSVLELSTTFPTCTFRYNLHTLGEKAIELQISSKKTILETYSHSSEFQKEIKTSIIPEPEPVVYAYAGKFDSIHALTNGMFKLIQMLKTPCSLSELLQQGQIKDPKPVLTAIKSLLKVGILQIRQTRKRKHVPR